MPSSVDYPLSLNPVYQIARNQEEEKCSCCLCLEKFDELETIVVDGWTYCKECWYKESNDLW